MFNVIISGEPNVWETDQLMRMDVTRFKEYSGGPEADKINIANADTWKLLEKAPTLLLYENKTGGVNADVVRYGFVREIRVNPRYVFFHFQEEGRTSRTNLNEFATRLGLSSFELNHTHWAVKEGGVPSAFKSRIVPYYDVVFSFAGEDRGLLKLRFLDVSVAPKQVPLCGTLAALRKSCGFSCLQLAELFHSRSICFATKHPPQHVVEPRGVRCAPALFSNRDEVALLQNDDELASVSPVAVRLLCYSPHWSIERSHNPKSIC